jgi:hypothetical protein
MGQMALREVHRRPEVDLDELVLTWLHAYLDAGADLISHIKRPIIPCGLKSLPRT